MEKQKLISFLLRIGISFSFFYAAIASFITPTNWIGFLPNFLRSDMILTIFSIYEILVGLWLLSGWKVFYPAILSALSMLGIIIFNFGALDIVFRDVAILFAAVALALLSYGR